MTLALWIIACAADPSGQSTPDDTADPTTNPTTTIPATGDVLVVPHNSGLSLLELDGTVAFDATWSELVGSCSSCGGEGASPDDDGGLLLAFTTGGGGGGGGGGGRSGAVARLAPDGTFDFRVDGFSFPHDVIRDPADDTLFVADTSANRLAWIAGDGSSSTTIRQLDSSADSAFTNQPNGADRFTYDGRTLVLVSHRGSGSSARITLWDITGDPEHVWTFPPNGGLQVPHGPVFRKKGGSYWLLWAHTEGASNGGSVGMAVTDDPTVAPTYVADLVPESDVAPFSFLRGVELADDTLILTDSGSGNNGRGRIIAADWPDLEPPGGGETGASGDQVFVDLGPAVVLNEGLGSPFEAWLWSGFTP